MTNRQIIESYIPIVDFISEAFGSDCEVVLHDVTQSERTIVAIRNGHVTGRNTDTPISESPSYVLDYFRENKHRNYIANYSGKSLGGQKTLRSSTFFIKDDRGELIGLICVNCDVTVYQQTIDVVSRLLLQPKENILFKREQNDGTDVRSVVSDIICAAISGLTVAQLSADEKRSIVEALNSKGVFFFKGALSDVARQLEVSEQTLYRYLKELQ